MGVLAPRPRNEENDHRVRAISTSTWKRTIQGCRSGLEDHGFLPDPLADRSHGLVRHTKDPCNAPQSFAFSPRRDFKPSLSRDTWSFDGRIPANSGASAGAKHSLRVEEGDKR